MHRSLRDHMNDLGDEKPTHYNSACAAAGQLALMSLYDTMFSTCDILCQNQPLSGGSWPNFKPL